MFICMDDEAYKDMPQIGEYEPKSQNVGTETMLKTWRGWMGQVATHMARRGAVMPLWLNDDVAYGQRPYTADDAHAAFTSLLLGHDKNGRRYSWSMSKTGHSNQASKHKRLWAMGRMQAWAANNGLVLRTKENSEFFQLQKQQEK